MLYGFHAALGSSFISQQPMLSLLSLLSIVGSITRRPAQ
jgi:hypothetical protein